MPKSSWKEDCAEKLRSFDPSRLQEARIPIFTEFERLLDSQKEQSELWWQMATEALPTLINWRCNASKHEELPHSVFELSHREIFLAYFQTAILKQLDVLSAAKGRFPKNLPDKIIEFLVNLSEGMVQDKILSVPSSSYASNPKDSWRTRMFGDPWNGTNITGLAFIKMVRDCASDFIQFKDNAWSFKDGFLGYVNSINVVEMVKIQSYFRTSLGKTPAEASKLALPEFANTLLNHPEGVMRFCRDNWYDENHQLSHTSTATPT